VGAEAELLRSGGLDLAGALGLAGAQGDSDADLRESDARGTCYLSYVTTHVSPSAHAAGS
jgi:hypothetical protein